MRSSGILMHITSLPGPYGVGTMGKHAFGFVDFLQAAGQKMWQILPLTPTGFGDSPYQSCSTFAGNHYLIDLDLLVEDGLLKTDELTGIRWCRKEEKVDFGLLYKSRLKVLRLAFDRFDGGDTFEAFCRDNASWLPDFALFMAVKEQHGGDPWYEWEDSLKHREESALSAARETLKDTIRFYCFVQYLFFRQWNSLHAYANEKGIRIIGDVPIYVPLDSVEVWSHPDLFQLDRKLDPIAVAGCPPDGFTEDGQLWGNPLYRWQTHKKQGYAWWIERLAAAGRMYDVIRLDHFRGFEAYWSVPYGHKTARYGKWVKGPGMSFVKALKQRLPDLPLIAEDLGFLTQEVLDLRDAGGWPGMKVLQFAFDPKEPSDYLPHTYIQNSVCYTGTHDNMTMRQWFDSATPEEVAFARDYMALTKQEGYVWGTIRTALSSVSDTCIIQLQDYLNLGGRARMNFPGTLSDSNWTWRVKDDIINEDLAGKIRELTRRYARI
ncbi:MAG: 4-alpha-glucanotransferase [Faecousia sp.]